MVNEHNRYREEEQELETDNVEESTTEEINEETTYESTEVNKKEKKNKKAKKLEDFEEYHLLVQEVANLKDDLLRNRADLENFKRRNKSY